VYWRCAMNECLPRLNIAVSSTTQRVTRSRAGRERLPGGRPFRTRCLLTRHATTSAVCAGRALWPTSDEGRWNEQTRRRIGTRILGL
jgi:hypothetical protein